MRVRGCVQDIRMAFFREEPQGRSQAAVQRSGRMTAGVPPFRTMRLFYPKLSVLSTAFPNVFILSAKNVRFFARLPRRRACGIMVPFHTKEGRACARPSRRGPYHVRRGTPGPSAGAVYHRGVGHHVFVHIGAAARFCAAGDPHHSHGAGHRGADRGAAPAAATEKPPPRMALRRGGADGRIAVFSAGKLRADLHLFGQLQRDHLHRAVLRGHCGAAVSGRRADGAQLLRGLRGGHCGHRAAFLQRAGAQPQPPGRPSVPAGRHVLGRVQRVPQEDRNLRL